MKSYIEINGRRIGPTCPPYVVAELSANHNGDIERAFMILEEAKRAGSDAVKIQTYTPETMTLDSDKEDFIIQNGLWKGQSLYELYRGAQTPREWHERLFAKARELDLTLFSSPFDSSAVDFLEDLNAPAYKIASFEIVDLPLIAYAARTKKPLIMSTGMADEAEIGEAIETARENGCDDIIVLHCVSGYPAPADQYNLRTMSDLANRFRVMSGLSDHTIDHGTSIAAVALGAVLIEKHFTLNREDGGVDSSFSIEPKELSALCRDAEVAWKALGRVCYDRVGAEQENVKFRRSLYAVEDIKSGEILTKDNIRSIRPGYGLSPKHLPDVLGKKAVVYIPRGTALTDDLFSQG